MLKPKNFILIFLLLFVGSYIFLESTAQKPIDWNTSYWKTHKKPFGADIFHKIFTEHHQVCQEVAETPFEFLSQGNFEGSYLLFNSAVPIGKYDVEKIINWVEKGNTLFISAEYLPGFLMDTLELQKKEFTFSNQLSYKTSLKFDTLNQEENFKFDRNLNVQYFSNTDTLDIEVLGYAKVENGKNSEVKNLPNFIRKNFGNGEIYLHLFPKVFTNYFLVDSLNVNYTESLLKNLNYYKDIYVDQNYKDQKEIAPKHILQYLIGNKYLKWAYYLILITGIIYIIFEGKRKQKPIKVLVPYENKTYAFTKTIADMYYSKQDHKSIATKLIEHFFDFVRDRYMISTTILNDEFVNQLASKSGQEPKKIRILLKNIKHIENQNTISKETLVRLEKQISILKN